MSTTLLKTLLSNQNLILSYIKEKLEIVNFIFWGYENDIPILKNNSFLHFTVHIYYRSIIVDTCTLFSDNKHQGSNFHLLTDPTKKYLNALTAPCITNLNRKLTECKIYFLKDILDLRNEEISHYKFRRNISISFDLEYLTELNTLYNIGIEILEIASSGFIESDKSSHYKTGLSGRGIKGLQKILKDLNGLDYYHAWKSGV
jgi:hypothetical protein